MFRSVRAALIPAAIALAVPASALATRGAPTAQRARVLPHTAAVSIPVAATVTGLSTGGTLTIMLNGGSTVSGAVTSQTRMVCPRVGVGRGRGATPPPPCDSSQLVTGEQVAVADLQIATTGAVFRLLVLLPPAAPSNT